jgi:hypothetical protein
LHLIFVRVSLVDARTEEFHLGAGSVEYNATPLHEAPSVRNIVTERERVCE